MKYELQNDRGVFAIKENILMSNNLQSYHLQFNAHYNLQMPDDMQLVKYVTICQCSNLRHLRLLQLPVAAKSHLSLIFVFKYALTYSVSPHSYRILILRSTFQMVCKMGDSAHHFMSNLHVHSQHSLSFLYVCLYRQMAGRWGEI